MRPPIPLECVDIAYVLKRIMNDLGLTPEALLKLRPKHRNREERWRLIHRILQGETPSRKQVEELLQDLRYAFTDNGTARRISPMLADLMHLCEFIHANQRNLAWLIACKTIVETDTGKEIFRKREEARRANEKEGRRRGLSTIIANRRRPEPPASPTPEGATGAA